MPMEPDTETALKQTARFAAEAVCVGGSNFLNGDLKRGSAYAVIGLLARATLGVPGALLVAAASFVDSTSGKSLPEHLGLNQPRAKPAPTVAETV